MRHLLSGLFLATCGCALGCATPSTVFVGPKCAEVSAAGAENLTSNSVIVPANGLPFSSTAILVKYPDGREETRTLDNNQIDSLRILFGTCLLGLGSLNLALYTLVKTDPVTANTELWTGIGQLTAGTLLAFFGWHPDQKAMSYQGECREVAPAPVAPAVPPSPGAPVSAPAPTAAPPPGPPPTVEPPPAATHG